VEISPGYIPSSVNHREGKYMKENEVKETPGLGMINQKKNKQKTSG